MTADVQDSPDVAASPAADGFREAMRRFASGVTIVTTVDDGGEWRGFTASAFCSLSIAPPLILVCQARTSTSHGAFMRCERFLVNILGSQHEDLALRFAGSGGDKFTNTPFERSRRTGLPILPDALAAVGCSMRDRHDGGDHVIFVGSVYSCRVRDGAPMLHFDSRFHGLAEPGGGR